MFKYIFCFFVVLFLNVPFAFSQAELNLEQKNRYGFNLAETIQITDEAGDILLTYYQEPIDVDYKSDASPVTKADIAVNEYLVGRLRRLTPHIPIVSEESFEGEAVGALYWLVDPMDGTKSFINKTGQFTVNIALIDSGRPVFGIIYAPLSGDSYFTSLDMKAYKRVGRFGRMHQISVRSAADENLTLIASHLHRSEDDERFIKRHNITAFLTMSSSIKFCLVAEGKADIYPRLGTTMAWDTAAGHAILLSAGGRMVFKESGEDFVYKQGDFKNPHFIAYGHVSGAVQ